MRVNFRAWDGNDWWYEGKRNGGEHYCYLYKMASIWSMTSGGLEIACSRCELQKLEVSIDGGKTWEIADGRT